MVGYAGNFQNIVVNATCSYGCVVQLVVEAIEKEGRKLEMYLVWPFCGL